MRVGSLFSGIGGLDHGLHQAGHEHVFFCESDPYRRDVLRARWPGVPVYDDVRRVADEQADLRDARAHPPSERQPEPWGIGGADGLDLLCGGFPCQDLSVAGQRRGLAGNRSGLFFEFARVADALRPRWLLVENVPGLLSSNGGRDFGTILGTLADLGYGVAWRCADSRHFDVPQRRIRVFIVGYLADGDPRAAAERAGQVLAVGTRCPRHPATRGEAREDVAGTLGGGAGERGWAQDTERMTFVASTLKSQDGRGWSHNAEATYVAAPLTKGSAAGHGVNQPGRRQEDDVNLVVAGPLGGGNDGAGRRSEDDPNLVAAFMPHRTLQRDGSVIEGFAERPVIDALHGPTGNKEPLLASTASVRRLTPTECERLQALPDGWTDLGGTPDSRRYAALGDAVTATVARWIGERLGSA